MNIRRLAATMAVLTIFSWSACAADSAKHAEKKEKKEVKKEEPKNEKRGGNVFVNFWVHTVGGTIGNGLKTGARKIENTFD